jgi:Aldolase/RraA
MLSTTRTILSRGGSGLSRCLRTSQQPSLPHHVTPLLSTVLLQRAPFATGPASGGEIPDDLLQKLGSLSTQALVDGLWVMGWPSSQIDGARPLAKGMKCVGRAVTLRFVPARPDIAQDKPPGGASPEYEAFELCGPNNVLVMSSVGPWESVGGDIKFLRLKQLQIGGLVTDGSVRDTDEIIKVRVWRLFALK